MLDLLLVDPDPEVLEDQLSKRFRVRSVRTQSAALRAIRRQLPHLMVIPQELGRSSGFVLCATVRANHPEVATLVHGASSRPMPEPQLLLSADGFYPRGLKPSAVEAAAWLALVERHTTDFREVREGYEARWAGLALTEPRLEHARDILERNPAARQDPKKLAKLLQTTTTGLHVPRRLSKIAIYEPELRTRMSLTAQLGSRVQLDFIEGHDGLAHLAEPIGPRPALVIVRVGPDSPVPVELINALSQRRRCHVLVHGGILTDAKVARQEPERLYPELLELVVWEMLEERQRQQRSERRHISDVKVSSAHKEVPFDQRGWWELLRSPVCRESLQALLFKEIPLPGWRQST
ncbi:MAG: hypothetical protein H6741_34540 [Alphaproteobacteria bacterium]|nr:hypothetical protein [Alphaproteobacteria bacterium]MCB9797827.1 hypothetical protein [Alphaproteobacteria bacterium]